ncbi:hypothetical protein B0H13DRAFT_2261394 [Mycena leptocephala]|nr:hypothetical protein B0H13DRAFT_2261394 [Mycena leptocephala]
MAGRFPVSLLLEAQYTVEEIPGVNPVRGPVCASTVDDMPGAAPLSEAHVCPIRGPVCCLLLEISEEPTGYSTFRLRLSRSPRTQETVSPKSDHTTHNAEGRSICIKADKIVSDWGPKGMRDSKLAGSTSMLGGVSTTAGMTEFGTLLTPADYSGFRSSVVDPLCHADIGEPRPEVWTYFRGEPACSCGFDSGFSLCMFPRLANRVAVLFFSPPTWPIPTERDLEIVEADEQMAESLIHTEATAQDTL